jgi:hypothetical protein
VNGESKEIARLPRNAGMGQIVAKVNELIDALQSHSHEVEGATSGPTLYFPTPESDE